MSKWLLVRTLCAFSLLCGPVLAEDDGAEIIHAPLGNRQGSQACAQSERLTEKGLDKQKANLEPSAEMLAARQDCIENGGEASSLSPSEKCSKSLQSKATYVTTHPNALHYVTAVTQPYGSSVQLEEGSIWNVYSGDGYKALNWLTTDNILILPNRNTFWNSVYPYRLLNQQTGASAQVVCSYASWTNSGYSRWIYSIDYYNCQLCLSDGSIWNIPFCDAGVLDSFLPGDYIIMGFNDMPRNGLGENILINFSTTEYVYSTCIYY